MVVPAGPFGGGEPDVGQRFPGASGLDQLRLEQADHALQQGVDAERKIEPQPGRRQRPFRGAGRTSGMRSAVRPQ